MTRNAGHEADEARLLAAEFEDVQPVWYSSNYVYLCRMCGPDHQPFGAIYKPLKGENPLWDFPEGNLYKREVAAYELAKLLKWDFVPPTVARDGPHGLGSLQLFVDHDPAQHFFALRDQPEMVPQLKRMAAFDVIANNADRKGGHCLLDSEGTIWGIDHGLCFHPQYKLRSVIWDWVGEPIEATLLADVDAVVTLLEARKKASATLTGLLSAAEIAAVVARARALLKAGVFPQPGPNRHYPWPLV